MNISPLKPIPVSYVVLPTDTTTYFVQSVLRDTASGAILQTINLKQDATYLYRYTGQFKPVSDPSGLGRYIDITVIPYTDSGHTTPSQNYAALQLNYVVLQPWIPTLGAGGGGSIDYEKLRLTIAEVVEEKSKGTVFPEIPEVQYDRIESLLREALDTTGNGLSANVQKGISGVNKTLGDIRKEHLSSNESLRGELLGYISDIHKRLSDSEISRVSSGKEMREEILNSMAKNKEEFMTMHGDFAKKLDKKYDDSSKSSMEDMKKQIADTMSGKEIKFNMNMSSESPKKKESSDMGEIMKLFA